MWLVLGGCCRFW
jgi:MFS family permease